MAKNVLMAILKEEGVQDLKLTYGIKMASLFARALLAERTAGKTTDEAMDLLNQAIDLETAAIAGAAV